MKFGKAYCELRNPGPGSNIESLPCYTGIGNERAIGIDKSMRSNGFNRYLPDFASSCFLVLSHRKQTNLLLASICRNLLRVATTCVLHLARIWQRCLLQQLHLIRQIARRKVRTGAS
jgi:hypothetical protein